jgi:hypothetical protein
MIVHARGWIAGIAGLSLALGLLSTGNAADDGKELVESVRKVAAALAKNDTAGAKKMADEFGKKFENDDTMALFGPRTKSDGKLGRGLGVGPKPGALKPDGIEKKLTELAKKPLPDKQLADESEALTTLGYDMAALAAIAHAGEPADKDKKAVFNKRKKDWQAWADELKDASLKLAVAAKEKKAADVHKLATKADETCSKCHAVFRD